MYGQRLEWPTSQYNNQIFAHFLRRVVMIMFGRVRIPRLDDGDLLGLGDIAPVDRINLSAISKVSSP